MLRSILRRPTKRPVPLSSAWQGQRDRRRRPHLLLEPLEDRTVLTGLSNLATALSTKLSSIESGANALLQGLEIISKPETLWS